jgi:hypothetical protein
MSSWTRRARAAVSALLLLAPGGAQDPPRRIWFQPSTLAFTLDSDESAARRVPETMAGGMAAFDYDNDGDLDLFFTNGASLDTLTKRGPEHWNRLFANDGQGRFTDVTARAGLLGQGFDNAAAAADYDNDGDIDLFVGGLHRNTLYRNNGDGTFTDVTAAAGLRSPSGPPGPLWCVGGIWADFNNDGWLDLFVVNYLRWEPGHEPVCEYRGVREYCHPKYYAATPNRLYLNRGDGTFRDASDAWGLQKQMGKGMGAAAADFDADGLMDVFVANDAMNNFLFRGLPGGRFQERALDAGVSLLESGVAISGMGVDCRDLDNDGRIDIVVVALDHETFPVFRNLGGGEFQDVTMRSGVGPHSRVMAGYSPLAADFDNDGWKDIFVSRGHVQGLKAARPLDAEQHSTVFRNLGGMRFAALTEEAGLAAQPKRRHRGSVVGDLNGDGRLDVAVSSIGGQAEVWLNASPPAHWLEIRLRGAKSNRDGIGARIKVVSAGLTQYNYATHAAGYASSSAGPVHFGLGADREAREIEIRWPSGAVQLLKGVAADRVVEVREAP